MTGYEVRISKTAAKEILALNARISIRIVAVIESLGVNPRPEGCVKLKGSDSIHRARIGDYRVLFEIRDKELVVIVLRIRHRRDVYRGL